MGELGCAAANAAGRYGELRRSYLPGQCLREERPVATPNGHEQTVRLYYIQGPLELPFHPDTK
jgi:hypothetical protein